MRFGAVGASEADIVWFFADDLPPLKQPTPYGSLNWRGEGELPTSGAGEIVGALRKWANGANPNPACCSRRAEWGGGKLGGKAGYWFEGSPVSTGGLVLSGSGLVGAGWRSTGGVVLNGSGLVGAAYRSEGGGVVLNGSGLVGAAYRSEGGGVVLAGLGTEATVTPVVDQMATAVTISDLVVFIVGATDQAELGVRISDDVIINPENVAGEMGLRVRITDVVAINPFPATDQMGLRVRITDVVAINPLAVAGQIGLRVRITDSVTTH